MKGSVVNSIDTNHEDMIHDAQLDYYGTKLATCSSDRKIKVFDVSNNQQILLDTLEGHTGAVWQVQWSHPMYGSLLASCGYDKKVIIWQNDGTSHFTKLYEYTNHESSVNSICWAPYELGLMLATGSSDGTIAVISSPGDGNWTFYRIPNAHTSGCNAVSFAPALPPGCLINQPDGQKPQYVKRIVSGGCDCLVKIWQEDGSGQWVEEHKLEGHSDWIRDVAWSPSVGLPRSTIASCSQDGRVMIWTREDKNSEWVSNILRKFQDAVWHVSWSVVGDILAVSCADNMVTLWKELPTTHQWTCISDVGKTRTSIGPTAAAAAAAAAPLPPTQS